MDDLFLEICCGILCETPNFSITKVNFLPANQNPAYQPMKSNYPYVELVGNWFFLEGIGFFGNISKDFNMLINETIYL